MRIPSLRTRELHAELMDGSSLPAADHASALAGLARLNFLSGSSRAMWRQIVARVGGRCQGLRILDIGSGGGDVVLGLWNRAQRDGIKVEILGLDRSPTACSIASRRCLAAGDAISFQCADVTAADLQGSYDVVTSTLFLHHLPRDEAIRVLARMAAAGRYLIVSDLRRSFIGYALAYAACHLVTSSRIVRHDGPQSVANAFTLREWRDLCQAAGLHRAKVRRGWPWRVLVTVDREGGNDGPA